MPRVSEARAATAPAHPLRRRERRSARARRRLGQGWYGFDLDPPAFAERVRRLDELLAKRGRARAELVVSVSPYLRSTTPDDLAAYAEAGADQVILTTFARDPDALRARLESLADTLLADAQRL